MEQGSLSLALFAAALLLGGLLLETRVLMRWRKDWYFAAGLPLGAQLVPIQKAPVGSGRTATVHWEVSQPHLVRFWSEPGQRQAPMGLHGIVLLAQGRRGIEMEVRWAPPWSAVLAACWLAGLGIVRGEGMLTVPIATLILVGLVIVYGERARRAAAELRWAFVQGEGSEGPPEEI
jgi:hypothetical protein